MCAGSLTCTVPNSHLLEITELPADPIDAVILVDTQSLVTLKNLRKDAAIHVVDHHLEKSNLPDHWVKTIEKVGATTTIFVNQLKEQNTVLHSQHCHAHAARYLRRYRLAHVCRHNG